MIEQKKYDVAIVGGGLSGLCLALQLKKSVPQSQILVVERSTFPQPEAAHKIGESSVESASHYLENILELGDLLERELRKFGLRFFMSNEDNKDITRRTECGPSHYLSFPSYQIDRGQFENGLADRVRELGIALIDGSEVESISLNSDLHSVGITCGDEHAVVTCRWVVDASGRRSLLKKKLALEHTNRHAVNAAWFRVDHVINPDDWADDPKWSHRLHESRHLSTNHFMGDGYWVWLIPLAKGRTSVGIVTDGKTHPFHKISNFSNAMAWLDEFEPQLKSVVDQHLKERMDFGALKNYSHDVKQVYSNERWCLTGDAGAFIDPLYSPGSDFIGISNSFVTDLITRDLGKENIDERVELYDQSFRSLSRTYLATYHRQYTLMGHPRIMITKIIWDFLMYWGGIALIFRSGRLTDPDFMKSANSSLQSFAYLNISTQSFFRKWAKLSTTSDCPPDLFVDYANQPFLTELNQKLTLEHDDQSLLQQLESNLILAKGLRAEIEAEAFFQTPEIGKGQSAPTTSYLEDVFHSMSGDQEPRRSTLSPEPSSSEELSSRGV